MKVRVFFEKNIEEKYLHHHDKNCCYFFKSNIPVINLILGSRFQDLVRFRFQVPNTDNFLAFFIVFEWSRISESEMDKQEVICNAELRHNYFSVNVSILAVVFCQKIKKNQQFCLKRLQKINYDVIVHYILLAIYPLQFPKFCPIQKQ